MDPNLRKILINKILDQIKIAIIDDNKLSHFFLEYENVQSTIRGKIYKAKINLDELLARAQHDDEISQVRLLYFDKVKRLLVSGEIFLAGVVGLLSCFLLKNLSAPTIST